MDRIKTICSYIAKSKTFADVGCDHGYCAEYALKSGLCEKVYITDVSAKCLAKAEKLLAKHIENGDCVSICCDGLSGLDKDCEQVLIAGMGGEEIMGILNRSFIPRKFIFQPMKNAPELRAYLLQNGCKITADDIFCDGKYYFIIAGEREGITPKYSEIELLFGRDSLNNAIVKDYAKAEADKKLSYLQSSMSDITRQNIQNQYEIYRKVAENDN